MTKPYRASRYVLLAPLVLGGASSCGRTVPGDQPGTDGGRFDAAPPPAAEYPRVSVGGQTSCSIDRTGRLVCWGAFSGTLLKPPDGVWADVSFSGLAGCAQSPMGTLGCWGSSPGPASPWEVPDARFKKVSVAGHACGVTLDDKLLCWGKPNHASTDAPPGKFKDVSAGSGHSCALRTDGTAICWGLNLAGQANAPEGTFASISAGNYISCAVRPDSTVQCWGETEGFAPQTGMDATYVSAGGRGVCIIRRTGSINCFGDELTLHPPEGQFSQLSLGDQHACAVRVDGKILCWGSNSDGQSTPPP